GRLLRTLTRRIRSPCCCARAASGHAAAPPKSATRVASIDRFAFGPRQPGPEAGYRIGDEQSAGIGTVLQPIRGVDARAESNGEMAGKFDKSGRDSVAATLKLVQSARHQHCKYDRNENERGHISHQMTALGRIAEGLNPHDRRVNHARPYGEPDEALVSVGMS